MRKTINFYTKEGDYLTTWKDSIAPAEKQFVIIDATTYKVIKVTHSYSSVRIDVEKIKN